MVKAEMLYGKTDSVKTKATTSIMKTARAGSQCYQGQQIRCKRQCKIVVSLMQIVKGHVLLRYLSPCEPCNDGMQTSRAGGCLRTTSFCRSLGLRGWIQGNPAIDRRRSIIIPRLQWGFPVWGLQSHIWLRQRTCSGPSENTS